MGGMPGLGAARLEFWCWLNLKSQKKRESGGSNELPALPSTYSQRNQGISSLYSRSGLNQNDFGSLLPKGWENQAQDGIILNPVFSWLWEEPRGDKDDFPRQIPAAPSGNLVPLLPPASSILSGIGIGNAVPGRAALAGRCPGTIPLRGTYQDLPLWARKIKGEKDKKKKQEKETGQGRGRKRQERERAGSTKKGGKSGKTAEENPLHAINDHSQR